MSSLSRRLDAAWHQAVIKNQIINEFEAAWADPSGSWAKGDRIAYGVKYIEEQFVYYARNLSQSVDIKGATAQKYVHSSSTQTKYLCRLNSYRALRPGAIKRSQQHQTDIPADASRCRFYCQDRTHPLSLLRRSPLLSVPLKHYIWNAYYNVAPLETTGHFLWIPTQRSDAAQNDAARGGIKPENNTLPHRPQQMTPAIVEDDVQLFSQLSGQLSSQLFGQLSTSVLSFNALQAGASVNHIHFQSIYSHQPLPIAIARTTEYNGYQLSANYPAQSAIFSPTQPLDTLLLYIEKLQKAYIPFNLAMLSEKIFVTARTKNNISLPNFSGEGYATLEICGAILVTDRAAFEAVTAALVERALHETTLPARKIIDALCYGEQR
ncbi:MAG: hypothetical protein ACFB16_10520 [Phormidesmis sp.]